jgi:hypothetical protein
MCPKRNGEANALRDVGGLGYLTLLSPHLSFSGEKEPNLLDRSMSHCPRCLARAQLKVSQPAP